MTGRAIIGQLSITVADGVTLTASNDLALAWLWAEYEVDQRPARYPGGWSAQSYRERCQHVTGALAGLRQAADQ